MSATYYIFPFIKRGDQIKIDAWIKNNKGISIFRDQGCWLGNKGLNSSTDLIGWVPGYCLKIENKKTELLLKLTFQYVYSYDLRSDDLAPIFDL